MTGLVATMVVLALGGLTVVVTHRVLVAEAAPVFVLTLASGRVPVQHALSRYHARWYAANVVFLAFDVEMLFMYPWTVVVADLGVGAVRQANTAKCCLIG